VCSGLVSSFPRLVRCLSFFLKVWYFISIVGVRDSCIEVCMVGHIGPHSLEAWRWALYRFVFSCSFFRYRKRISSLMRMVDIFCWVVLEAGEVYGTWILA
jgi:hypothetical protein